MDRQIDASRAWIIPYKISKEIKSFDIKKLGEISLEKYIRIFNKNKLHRFNNKMAEIFYLGVKRINDVYGGDASKIWKKKPFGKEIVDRMREFKGAKTSIKIAPMTANILARDFKIPMKDFKGIDISPDVHVETVFKRVGFVDKDSTRRDILEFARKLNPEYPGIIDYHTFDIGKAWCSTNKPNCKNCYLNSLCPKIIEKSN